MNKRPFPLTVFAMLMVLVALTLGIQVVDRFGIESVSLVFVWENFTTLTKVIFGLCFLNALLALNASRWLFLSAPLLTALVIWNNYLLFRFMGSSVSSSGFFSTEVFGIQLSPALSFGMSSVLFIAMHYLLFVGSAYRALSMPELRWWKNSQRLKITLPIQVNAGDNIYDLVSFDISESGLFVTNQTHAKSGASFSAENFSPSDPVEILLKTSGAKPFRLRGEVVRLQMKNSGVYPQGIGIRFEKLGFVERLKLKKALLAFWMKKQLGYGDMRTTQ